MDTKGALSLELVATDSPAYRASLVRFELEQDHCMRSTDTYLAILRHWSKEVVKENEAMSAFANRLPEMTMSADKASWQTSASDILAIYHAKAKLVDDMIELVIEPLEAFYKEMREMKTFTKTYDTMKEKYDNAISRYGGLSKGKDAAALREEALVLFEFRKQYIRAAFEVTQRVILCRDKMSTFIQARMLACIAAHAEFHKAANEVHEGLANTFNEMRVRQSEDGESKARSPAQVDNKRKALEEAALMRARPNDGTSLDFPPVLEKGPSRYITSPSAPQPTGEGPVEKEGYLFRRIPGRAWVRRYFKLEKGGFSFETVSPKHPGVVLSTPAVNILLCSVRVVRSEERRFCFECSTVYNKHSLLQAETEEELVSWISCFEAAKRHAISHAPVSTAVSDWTIGDGKHDDEEDGIPLHKVAFSGIAATPSQDDDSADEEDGIGSDEPHAEGEGDIENEIRYSDPSIRKENVRLHRLLRQVPRSDGVIDAFSCAWRKDIAVHGRMYLTYDRICFYSNILGFVSMLVINLKHVSAVVIRRNALYTTISVTNQEGTNTFKAFLKDYTRYTGIKTVWQNATAETRKSPQEIYEALHPRKVVLRASVAQAELPGDDDARGGSVSPTGNPGSDAKYALPSEISEPTGEVPCGCGADHLEQKDVDVIFPVPAKQLYEILFDDAGTFWSQRFHPKRGETARSQTPWADGVRDVRYTMPVNNSMVKVKEAEVHLTQTLVKNSPYLAYVVESKSETLALPYSDAFNPMTRYCVTWVSKTSCRLVMTCGILWHKSPMVKGIIRKAAMAGMAESSVDTVAFLKKELAESTESTGGNGTARSGEKSSIEAGEPQQGSSHTIAARMSRDSWTKHPITVIVLALLLACSMLAHGLSWWRGGHDALATNGGLGTRPEAELMSMLEWSRTERDSFKRFMSTHYTSLPSFPIHGYDAGSNATTDSAMLVAKPQSRARYRTEQHRALYLRLLDLQTEIRGVKNEAAGVLSSVANAEREVIEAQFLNWLADQV